MRAYLIQKVNKIVMLTEYLIYLVQHTFEDGCLLSCCAV
jgi:hypothetical protein